MGASQSAAAWLELLSNTTVHDVLKVVLDQCSSYSSQERAKASATGESHGPGHLVQLKSTDTLAQALQVFKENNIQSAPVWSESAQGDMGFLDLTDAVAFIAQGAKRDDKPLLIPAEYAGVFWMHLTMIEDFSHKNDVVEILLTTTLKKVFDVMSKTHLHRLAVLDIEKTRVIDVITQSDALAWICRHAGEPHMTSLSSMTLKELGLSHKKDMVTSSSNDMTLWAYGHIAANHISALPVVDEAGQLVGALSGVQLRGMVPSEIDQLGLPLLKFLEKRQHFSLNYCIPATTFGAALSMMNSQRLHRLFIVDVRQIRIFGLPFAQPASLRPISVLTLSDVLRELSTK